jgi:hypothetical protein
MRKISILLYRVYIPPLFYINWYPVIHLNSHLSYTWQLSVENHLVSMQGLPCDFLVSKNIRQTMTGMPVGQQSIETTVAELLGAM